MRFRLRMPCWKKVLCCAGALAVVAGLFIFMQREPGDLEPLVPNCPIKWATASYGTEHRFHTFRGRPLGFPALGDLLIRLNMAYGRRHGGRTPIPIAGTVGRGHQKEPSLIVRVLVPPPTTTPPTGLYRVTVSDERGILAVSNGYGRSWTIESYEFYGLPITSAKGLIVDFYAYESNNYSSFPTNSSSGPIARLKL